MRITEAKVCRHGGFWEQKLVQYKQKVAFEGKITRNGEVGDKIGRIG